MDDKGLHLVFLTVRAIEAVAKPAMYVLLARYAYFSIEALAGKKTDASFVLNYIFASGGDHWLPWVVSFFAMLYGSAQHVLRKRKTAYFSKRISDLELRIDPSRTSSELLPTGETNPKDRGL